MKTWQITYTIRDGAHEYADSFTFELDAQELDGNTVAAFLADYFCFGFGPEERQKFVQDLAAGRFADLYDGRAIGEIGWEPVSPAAVTVRDGKVQSVTGHVSAYCSVPGCQAEASRWFEYEGVPNDTFYLCDEHREILSPDDDVVRILTPDMVPVERELAVYACHEECPLCG